MKEETSDGWDRFEKMLTFLKKERKREERMILLKNKTENKLEKNKIRDQKEIKHFTGTAGSSDKRKLNPGNCCLIHPNSSHLTRKCREFLAKTVEERGQIIKDTKCCKLCLSFSHVDKPCPFESKWEKCKIRGCEEHHSRLVHECKIQGVGFYMEGYNA